ncbi:hypothetical protein [Rhizobium ruizarguesonis]|jgi:hypothetical protein|uniref:hypothetical protein n=1 Tax=Rhizobium ruizarguesonis TaxID=2081791 RepID=UPI00102FCD7B|nr:hypothetical protein [Rhizobium ruizarguesonis]TBA57912.1 hypothetical protein ELH59_07665 [Rhizobium ruizarguesonis]TBB03448.1 hypothetical protein ELH52_18500 [Rhizobium ruizarguesonis]
MTTHAAIKTANRTALPRALLGRRHIRKSEYQFSFEMGQLVTLLCTNEPAVIVGRSQTIDCIDEYVIELVEVDCDPLRVFDFQIA